MKKSDLEKALKKLEVKALAMQILRNTTIIGGEVILGSYLCDMMIKAITDGDPEYCERHGHMMHSKYDFCVLCNKKGEPNEQN